MVSAYASQAVWETSVVASRQLPDDACRVVFVTIVFVTAGVFSAVFTLLTRVRLRGADVRFGLLAGACSVVGSGARVWATRDLGGLVVIPVTAVTVTFLVQAASYTVWRERMGRWGLAGFIAAVAGVLLLSLKL